MVDLKKLLRKFYLLPLLVMAIFLLFVTRDASHRFQNLYMKKLITDLTANADLAGTLASDAVKAQNGIEANVLCKTIALPIGNRMTLILPDGKVIGDSEKNPSEMENHSDRPEFKQAMTGGTGVLQRYSLTLDEQMIYVAVPIQKNGRIVGVARISRSLEDVHNELQKIHFRLGLAVWIVAILLAAIVFGHFYRLKRSVASLRKAVGKYTRGDFDHRLYTVQNPDLDTITIDLNEMAAQMQARLALVIRQRDELETVLSSMMEGVLVIDTQERIIRINHAVEKWFNVKNKSVHNRMVQEVLRNSELLNFIEKTLSSSHSVEEDIVFYGKEESYLQLHGTVLRSHEGKKRGALIVLNDVTRLRRLENIRRDFVANVSHELKTPITSIKGFVETLKDGAIYDPKSAKRFLNIILKHADRLNTIIDDLLNLSRIEQEVEKREIRLEEKPLKEVLIEAVSICHTRSEGKDIKIQIFCKKNIKARIHPELMERAVVNLIDNAIKYSPNKSKIRVEGSVKEDRTIIRVQDWGSGIPKEHLPRLFERFYRVDPARSRALGGTGLGLAIVKHIVQAHNGEVSVESDHGNGSLFTIILPSGENKERG